MALAKPHPGMIPRLARGSRADSLQAPREAWRSLGLTRACLTLPMARPWAVVPLAVIALIYAGALLQPAPATEATRVQAAVEGIVASVFFAGTAASVFGAMSLQRWGLAASFALGVATIGLLVSCPVSGHHTWGIWFAGESVCVLAATGLAGAALWRTNR